MLVIEGFSVDAANGIGVVGVCVLLVLGFATGRIYTKRQYDDQAQQTTEWRVESRLKDQQIVVKDEQIREKDLQLRHMGEVGETQKAVLAALQGLIGRQQDGAQ